MTIYLPPFFHTPGPNNFIPIFVHIRPWRPIYLFSFLSYLTLLSCSKGRSPFFSLKRWLKKFQYINSILLHPPERKWGRFFLALFNRHNSFFNYLTLEYYLYDFWFIGEGFFLILIPPNIRDLCLDARTVPTPTFFPTSTQARGSFLA